MWLSSAGDKTTEERVPHRRPSFERAAHCAKHSLQGMSAVSPTVFGNCPRCAGGTLKRISLKHVVGSTSIAPQTGHASISARSAALGDTSPIGAMRS